MHTLPEPAKKSWSGKIGNGFRVLAVSIGALLLSLPAFPQANLGRILGSVSDQTGGAIANATVNVIDVQRGVTRNLTTDSAGEYSASSLTPGTYTVHAEAKGFNTVERKDILLEVGKDVRVDLTLPPGSQAQTITVTEQAAIVDATSATLGGTIENQTITDLPVNGRNYQSMLDYRPGILSRPGGGTGSKVSNGMRSTMQVWLLDGLYDNNAYGGFGSIVGGPSQAGEAATILPIDAIQEVDIQENPKAEMGWKPGAQINVGLKSGTNSIHGTAYAYGRDTSLDARNPFFPSTAALAMEQFGVTGGGPIKKDKIFYFGAYEGQRFIVGNPSTISVPTTASLATSSLPAGSPAGSFPDAIAFLELPANGGYCNPAASGCTKPLSQLSLNLAGCTLPAGLTGPATCNAANGVFGNSSGTTSEPVSYPNIGNPNDQLEKIDYHLNEHNSLNGEYYFAQDSELAVSAAVVEPYWRTQINTRAQVARGVWTWTPNATLVNDARFGFDRVNIPNINGDCFSNGQPNYTALGLTTGASGEYSCGFPSVTVGSFLGLGSAASRTNLGSSLEGSDTVSYTRGKHLFKFGVEIRNTEWEGGTFTGSKGTISFTSLQTFMEAVPSTGSIIYGSGSSTGNPTRTMHRWEDALFAQDDWRLTRKLTLNLGLRYELVPAPTEENDLLANFSPTLGMVQLGKQISSIYNTDPKEFAPRLGLAWDVTGKGTSVVRAGIDVMYALPTFQEYVATGGNSKALVVGLQADPTGATIIQPNGVGVPGPGSIELGTISFTSTQLNWLFNPNGTLPAVFPVASTGLVCGNGQTVTGGTAKNPSPCNIVAVQPNIGEPYVTAWNLGVQHVFGNTLSMDVSYVGNHGTKLWGLYDLNSPTPGPSGAAVEQTRRPYYSAFPYLGNIDQMGSDDISNYDGLQATLTERASHGLTFLAGYTYGHGLDEGSGEPGSIPQNSYNPRGDYGSVDFDVRNRFTLAGTYAIPGVKSPLQLLEGWKINSAVNLIGALPFNATDGVDDLSGTGEYYDRWDLVGNASDFKAGGPSGIPCFGAAASTFAAAGCGALPAACISAATTAGMLTSLDKYGCYMEGTAVIVPPAQGTFGTMGRNVLRGKGLRVWDMSVTKAWKFRELYGAEFRFEAFNLLNSPQYATPSSSAAALTSPGTFGESQGTPDVINHNPMIGSGAAREMQLGLKLTF